MMQENRLTHYSNITEPTSTLGSTVEVSEIESLARGTIIVGDASGAPTTLDSGSANYILTTDTEETTGLKYVLADSIVSNSAGFYIDGAISIGDGAAFLMLPEAVDGKDLIAVRAAVGTAPSGGEVSLQIHNVSDAVDMLSTPITIDDGETSTLTAEFNAEIDVANDDVATNDVLRLDIDAANGAEDLMVTLTFYY